MRKMKVSEKAEKYVYAALAIATFFLAWAFITTFTAARETTPGPVQVIRLLFTSFFEPIGRYTIYGHLYYSLRRVLVGYTVAAVSGIVVGISMGTSRYAEAIIKPLFELIRPIPPIAWIPIMVVLLGIGVKAKAAVIFLASVVPCVINTYAGIKQVNPVHIWVAQIFGATNLQMLRTIGIPTAMPMIFTGVRVALNAAWMALVAAELLASTQGLGYMIQISRTFGRPDIIIAGMFAIGVLSMLFNLALSFLEKAFVKGGI